MGIREYFFFIFCAIFIFLIFFCGNKNVRQKSLIKKKEKEKTAGNPLRSSNQLRKQRSKLNLDPTLKFKACNYYAKTSDTTDFERSFSNLKITINPLHFLLQKKGYRDKIDKFFQDSHNYISSHISFNLRYSPSLLISKSFPVAQKPKKKKKKVRTYPAAEASRTDSVPSISIHHSPNLSGKYIHENALLSPKSNQMQSGGSPSRLDAPFSRDYSCSNPVNGEKKPPVMKLNRALSRSQSIISEAQSAQFKRERVKPVKTVSFRAKKDTYLVRSGD